MSNYKEITWDRQPRHIIQREEELNGYTYMDYFSVEWDGPNRNFGVFRVSPLKNTIAQNRAQVLTILRNAYNGLTLRSFDEAILFAKQMKIRIVHIRYDKKHEGHYTWYA